MKILTKSGGVSEINDATAISTVRDVIVTNKGKWAQHSEKNLKRLNTAILEVWGKIANEHYRYLQQYEWGDLRISNLQVAEQLPRFSTLCELLMCATKNNLTNPSGWNKALADIEKNFMNFGIKFE